MLFIMVYIHIAGQLASSDWVPDNLR